MLKTNFAMSVQFSNGTVSEMYNCCGLKATTTEKAINDGMKIFIRNYDVNRFSKSKTVAAHWENAKVYSVRCDVRNPDGTFSHREHTLIEGEKNG